MTYALLPMHSNFQNIDYFDFSTHIVFTKHTNICYVHIHIKKYISRKFKKIYNLELVDFTMLKVGVFMVTW